MRGHRGWKRLPSGLVDRRVEVVKASSTKKLPHAREGLGAKLKDFVLEGSRAHKDYDAITFLALRHL